ncbi:unnamed protein product [Discosporangium mesarthrocarpum]
MGLLWWCLVFLSIGSSGARVASRGRSRWMIRGGASNPSDTHELSAENEKIAVPGEVDRVTNENSGKVKRVVVTGGAGQIAYALLPLILHGKVFGPDCKVSLRLLDIRACSKALEGVAMEVRDCNCDVLLDVMATTDTDSAFDGADVAILLGGVPRGPGMERRDLIARNVPIMAEHGRALERAASKDVRVVVVANPANTNCLVVRAAGWGRQACCINPYLLGVEL